MALFVFFYLGATKGDFEVPPTIVAYATTAPWLLGLAGLTYGLISTSWDEDVEGSFLGVDEFQTNVARIFDGTKRGGENEELRAQLETSTELSADAVKIVVSTKRPSESSAAGEPQDEASESKASPQEKSAHTLGSG